MKILALIPARGGSKRLPDKNVRRLGPLPLIGWSIKAARESGCCHDVLVSTDDEGIAAVARDLGASVPWLRPPELATDTATTAVVALHALEHYPEKVDGLLLLQPTSPFRPARAIRSAVQLFSESGGARSVVSVSPAAPHPAWTFRETADGVEPFLGWETMELRSQDLPPAWALNGSIYLISPDELRQRGAFLAPSTQFLVVEDALEALDIDTQVDWATAEACLTLQSEDRGDDGQPAPRR